jgi:protein subunit release factor B
VTPSKQQALQARLLKLGIREEDLDEQFVRSSGPGGQNVNKVATCVVLVHRPTGLMVRCQQARAQGLNRLLARQRLAEKMEERLLGRASQRQQEIEKLRRQKRRRSRRAKEKMLRDKRHRSAIKEGRGKPPPDSSDP